MTPETPPLISVVVAVYNGQEFLRPAIDSILAQTCPTFELIIVDDASTDDTPRILDGYTDPRLVRLRNDANLGPYRAANCGLSLARGRYVARHDADDVSHPERLRLQVDYLEAHPRVGLLHSDYQMIDRAGRVLESVSLPADDAELRRRLETKNILVHGTILVRGDIFASIGGYQEAFPVSQDYDLYLRAMELAELANLQQPLYGFRFHGASISRNRRALQLACRDLAWEQARRRRAGLPEAPIPEDVIAAYPPDPARLFQDARGVAYLYYAAGQVQDAAEALRRARALQASASFDDAPGWEEWTLGAAHRYAALQGDPADGAGFLTWATHTLHHAGMSLAPRRLLGRYYAEQAFRQARQGRAAGDCARRAITNQPAWLFNRGLLKLALRGARQP